MLGQWSWWKNLPYITCPPVSITSHFSSSNVIVIKVIEMDSSKEGTLDSRTYMTFFLFFLLKNGGDSEQRNLFELIFQKPNIFKEAIWCPRSPLLRNLVEEGPSVHEDKVEKYICWKVNSSECYLWWDDWTLE